MTKNDKFKRFYKNVSVEDNSGKFRVLLDGKMINTPFKNPFEFTNEKIANAISCEWDNQKEEIFINNMPLTQISNTLIDQVRGNRKDIIDALLTYIHTDLLCYRASEPKDLYSLQNEKWQPLLDWLKLDYNIDFKVTTSILPNRQDDHIEKSIKNLLYDMNDDLLGLCLMAATSCGSLITALALVKGKINSKSASYIAMLDEYYQMEQWGEDQNIKDKFDILSKDLTSIENYISFMN